MVFYWRFLLLNLAAMALVLGCVWKTGTLENMVPEVSATDKYACIKTCFAKYESIGLSWDDDGGCNCLTDESETPGVGSSEYAVNCGEVLKQDVVYVGVPAEIRTIADLSSMPSGTKKRIFASDSLGSSNASQRVHFIESFINEDYGTTTEISDVTKLVTQVVENQDESYEHNAVVQYLQYKIGDMGSESNMIWMNSELESSEELTISIYPVTVEPSVKKSVQKISVTNLRILNIGTFRVEVKISHKSESTADIENITVTAQHSKGLSYKTTDFKPNNNYVQPTRSMDLGNFQIHEFRRLYIDTTIYFEIKYNINTTSAFVGENPFCVLISVTSTSYEDGKAKETTVNSMQKHSYPKEADTSSVVWVKEPSPMDEITMFNTDEEQIIMCSHQAISVKRFCLSMDLSSRIVTRFPNKYSKLIGYNNVTGHIVFEDTHGNELVAKELFTSDEIDVVERTMQPSIVFNVLEDDVLFNAGDISYEVSRKGVWLVTTRKFVLRDLKN